MGFSHGDIAVLENKPLITVVYPKSEENGYGPLKLFLASKALLVYVFHFPSNLIIAILCNMCSILLAYFMVIT